MRTFGQYLSTNDVSIYESLTKTSEEMSRALANWTQNFILSAISVEDRDLRVGLVIKVLDVPCIVISVTIRGEEVRIIDHQSFSSC